MLECRTHQWIRILDSGQGSGICKYCVTHRNLTSPSLGRSDWTWIQHCCTFNLITCLITHTVDNFIWYFIIVCNILNFSHLPSLLVSAVDAGLGERWERCIGQCSWVSLSVLVSRSHHGSHHHTHTAVTKVRGNISGRAYYRTYYCVSAYKQTPGHWSRDPARMWSQAGDLLLLLKLR